MKGYWGRVVATGDTAGDTDGIDLVAHETAVLLRRAESARQREQALDRSAYLLLDAIATQDALALYTLAEHFQLDASTVSRQVATLLARQLVERRADPADGRICLLAITAMGSAELQAARARRHDFFAELLADWSVEERQALGAALQRLNQAIARRDSSKRPSTVGTGLPGT
jgi:DNA-binding MarR family transcriptional regulator